MAYYCVQGCKLACTEPCRACGRGCSLCFQACDQSCSAVTSLFCPRDRASPVFLIYTIALNAIPGALAVAAAAIHWRNDCANNLPLWLLVYALIFGLFMIVFACRIHAQYNQPGSLDQGRRSGGSIDRFLHIFWWEPLVAAYFVMCPAAFAWSIVGLNWAAKSAEARHHHESIQCSRALIHTTRVSAAIMIGYLALSFAVGVLSCCCSCMMGAFQTSDEENQEYSSYQQDGQPPMRPQGSLEPGASVIGSLFHPQQKFQWAQPPSAPEYQPLPGGSGGNGSGPHTAPPPMQMPPPSGASAPQQPPARQGSPAVPPLNLPPRDD